MRRLLCLCAGLLLAAPAAFAEAVDLTGTWYVLVHYKDETSARPDVVRWEDRVWVFELQGEKLVWRDYPIVVFQDESNRFERLGTSRQSRVVGAWEPNEAQMAQIHSGLEYNTRGVKEKTLAREGGQWKTMGSANPKAANIITFESTWSIQGQPDRPVFVWDDVLGSAAAEAAEGRTQFKTESLSDGGMVLRGGFERDAIRHGSFQMIRSGEVSITKGSGKTQAERLRDSFLSTYGADFGIPPELERQLESGKTPESLRTELRKSIRDSIEGEARKAGQALPSAEVDTLVNEIERALIDDGKSTEEVRRMLQDGRMKR